MFATTALIETKDGKSSAYVFHSIQKNNHLEIPKNMTI